MEKVKKKRRVGKEIIKKNGEGKLKIKFHQVRKIKDKKRME